MYHSFFLVVLGNLLVNNKYDKYFNKADKVNYYRQRRSYKFTYKITYESDSEQTIKRIKSVKSLPLIPFLKEK